MRLFPILVMVWSPFLGAIEQECAISIDSGFAEYSDKSIVLHDNVTIEHGLGKLSADAIDIIPQASSLKPIFQVIAMKGNVHLDLKDGGKLLCERAEIDFKEHEGAFFGNNKDKVIFTEDYNKTPDSPPIPLVITSRSMKIYLNKEKGESPSSHNRIERIGADNDVTVDYNKTYFAKADYATYQRHPELTSDSTAPLPGLILLHANQGLVCSITNNVGDIIEADRISINTVDRQMLFNHPRGAMRLAQGDKNQELVNFSCDTLTWDDVTHTLTLKGHVAVSQHGIGILTTDDQIQCIQGLMPDGHQRLTTIESVGTTVLRRVNAENGSAQTLTCYSTAKIDHIIHQLVMTSPTDSYGNVIEGKQVLFQDEMGEIFGDKLTILYTLLNGTLSPARLIIEGNVRLKNHGAIDHTKSKVFLEYAVADKMTYTLATKELALAAWGKGRVLFFDRINNLQVSAPGLKIYRTGTGDEPEIQGVGDVRFKFLKRELNEIRKQFPREQIEEAHDGTE